MADRAKAFRELHANLEPLRLPNAWDAGSARLFESLGASAIATTSGGVAWACGYPDDRKLPVDVALGAAASMARVLKVPLTVDIENGYSDDATAVAVTIGRLLDVGVVGINIEDGSDSPSVLAAKIEAIKNQASKSGHDIFVNARTDVYLAALVDESKRVEEVLARGSLYRSAGADGLFVPALLEPDEISAIVSGVELPINVLAWPGLLPAAELGQLGVRRLSAGTAIPQILWIHAKNLGREFLETGSSALMSGEIMGYPELQGLFAAR